MTIRANEAHGRETLTIAISGSSGFIGRALARSLAARGHRVRHLVRRAATNASEIAWNPRAGEIDTSRMDGVDAVINLAGESLDQRWSDDVKRAIRDSRVQATTLLASTIASLPRKPRVFLSGSAVGIYGDRGDEMLDESSALGDDFLANVCQAWEASTDAATQAGVRVAHLRTGVVLAKDGGALARMLTPFRFGIGGKLGSGKQWMSWITRDDHVAAMEFLLGAADVSGPVNLTAPHPVTNEALTAALGNELHRPSFVPVPKLALELILGEMADAAVLASQRAIPRRLDEAGFTFTSPRIEDALAAILG